jgi:hypothetical protein
MSAKPNDFIVRLDGLKLDEAARGRISAAIQSAVVAELGRLDLPGLHSSNRFAYFPIRWPGFWLREINELPSGLGELGKTLTVNEG